MKEELKELAKKRGLDIAEDALQDLGELAVDIVGLVVAKSGNKYDDLAFAALEGQLRESLKQLIDKLDGEDDV